MSETYIYINYTLFVNKLKNYEFLRTVARVLQTGACPQTTPLRDAVLDK